MVSTKQMISYLISERGHREFFVPRDLEHHNYRTHKIVSFAHLASLKVGNSKTRTTYQLQAWIKLQCNLFESYIFLFPQISIQPTYVSQLDWITELQLLARKIPLPCLGWRE